MEWVSHPLFQRGLGEGASSTCFHPSHMGSNYRCDGQLASITPFLATLCPIGIEECVHTNGMYKELKVSLDYKVTLIYHLLEIVFWKPKLVWNGLK